MEEKNKNMVLKISIILIVLIVLFLIYDFTPIIKAPIGNIMFGYNQCTLEIQKNSSNNTEKEGVFSIIDFDDKHSGLACDVVSTWKCKLCWRIERYPNTAVPMLCDLCSELTNRCKDCADLLDINK